MSKTRRLAYAALFAALSLVGANLKIFSSIALDSMPGFLGAMVLGPGWGAAIGALGHLLTAMTSGFPFGLPAHAVIALCMALTMAAFSGIIRGLTRLHVNRLLACIAAAAVAVVINGPVDVLALMPLLAPAMGKEVLLALIPVLSLAAAANAGLAVVVYHLLPGAIREKCEVHDAARNR